MTSTNVDPKPPGVATEPQEVGAAGPGLEVLAQYRLEYPSAANAVEIFAGDWSSTFPAGSEIETGGFVPLFDDGRLDWMAAQLGGIEGAARSRVATPGRSKPVSVRPRSWRSRPTSGPT